MHEPHIASGAFPALAIPAWIASPPGWILPALGGWAFGQLQALGSDHGHILSALRHRPRGPLSPPRMIQHPRGGQTLTPAGAKLGVPGRLPPQASPRVSTSGWFLPAALGAAGLGIGYVYGRRELLAIDAMKMIHDDELRAHPTTTTQDFAKWLNEGAKTFGDRNRLSPGAAALLGKLAANQAAPPPSTGGRGGGGGFHGGGGGGYHERFHGGGESRRRHHHHYDFDGLQQQDPDGGGGNDASGRGGGGGGGGFHGGGGGGFHGGGGGGFRGPFHGGGGDYWRRHHYDFDVLQGQDQDDIDDGDPDLDASGWLGPALAGFTANQLVHYVARWWDGRHKIVPVTGGRLHLWGLQRPGEAYHAHYLDAQGPGRYQWHPIRWLRTSAAMLSPRIRYQAGQVVKLVQAKDPRGTRAVQILNDRVLAGGLQGEESQSILDVIRRLAGI